MPDDDRDEYDPRPRKRRRRDEDDEYDDDYDRRRHRDEDSTGGMIPYKNPSALLAYYTAIFGFFVPLIGGIAAIVLGIKGMKYAKAHPRSKGQAHAMIGIIGGSFCVLFWLFILLCVIAVAASKK